MNGRYNAEAAYKGIYPSSWAGIERFGTYVVCMSEQRGGGCRLILIAA